MQKLKKYAKIVKTILDGGGCLNDLKKYGFKTKKVTGLTGKIYVNEKNKIVIKKNYLYSDVKPKNAIVTMSVSRGNRKILIQPMVNVSAKNRKKAYKMIEKRMTISQWERFNQSFDIHEGNTALYRNKPVMIDW